MANLKVVLANQARRLREDAGRAASGERLLRHVPTGFTVLDDAYGGIQIGVATELMAHTSDGKSAFARQVAEAAARVGAGAIWFCGEDPEDSTAERFFADATGVSATAMGRLDVSGGELDRIDRAAKEAGEWASRIEVRFGPVDVDEILAVVDGTPTVGGVPLKLVIVDYLQIMAASRQLEDDIARLSTQLNARAGARRVAVLLLSQVASDVLKRGREYYQQHRDVSQFTPGLGDTEWCRRAEKSTKAVWALVRPGRWRREMGEDAADDYAELHVRKASFGPTGWETLGWRGDLCRFENK
jgi:replicative DNA helicase